LHSLLTDSWDRAWTGVGAHGDGYTARDAVLGSYGDASRRYHSLQHLQECLALFESVRGLCERPAEVEVALWFHDAIYVLTSSLNEEHSAQWAREVLLQAGVQLGTADYVGELILATKHSALPDRQDAKVLVDVDLSILGADKERFDEYERQIRDEYAFVPQPAFVQKRREILQSLLARPSIYGTPEMQRRFEDRARANLSLAVDALA